MAGLMAEVNWKVLERRARTKRSDSSVLILFGLTGAWWAAVYGVTELDTT